MLRMLMVAESTNYESLLLFAMLKKPRRGTEPDVCKKQKHRTCKCIDGRRHSFLTGSNCTLCPRKHAVVIGKWRETTGKYTISLHSCIPVTDKVKINEIERLVRSNCLSSNPCPFMRAQHYSCMKVHGA